MYVLFHICLGIGFCGLTWEKVYTWEEFWNVPLLMAEFHHPEVTLCIWQDVKIRLPFCRGDRMVALSLVSGQSEWVDFVIKFMLWLFLHHVAVECNIIPVPPTPPTSSLPLWHLWFWSYFVHKRHPSFLLTLIEEMCICQVPLLLPVVYYLGLNTSPPHPPPSLLLPAVEA